MAFKSNGCNTIGFYIVSRTSSHENRRMNAKTVLRLLVTFLAVCKTVKFVPEDLSIYDRVNEARADIEKLSFQ